MTDDYKISVMGNCGKVHSTLGEWTECAVCRDVTQLQTAPHIFAYPGDDAEDDDPPMSNTKATLLLMLALFCAALFGWAVGAMMPEVAALLSKPA